MGIQMNTIKADGFKPCPFCGSGDRLHMVTWSNNPNEWQGRVFAECCGFNYIIMNVYSDNEAETVSFYKRHWNKRP